MAEDKKGLLKNIRKAAVDHLPELAESIPGIGGAAKSVIEIIREGVNEHRKEKEAPPLYMDWAAFYCKEGCRLSEGQIDLLTAVIDFDYEVDDEDIRDRESYDVVKDFINVYMGETVSVGNPDECTIEADFLYFIFAQFSEHPYNEEALNQMLNALNKLLGAPVFERYKTGGHNESWDIN